MYMNRAIIFEEVPLGIDILFWIFVIGIIAYLIWTREGRGKRR